MKVTIKSFDGIEMEVKNKGIEFEIRDPNGGRQLGDIVLTKTGLTWCRGRTSPKNGIKIEWSKFIEWAQSDP